MPTVPGNIQRQLAEQEAQRPTPEQLLMTAADMNNRGQLSIDPTAYTDPKASLKLPSYGKRTKPSSKRR